MRSLWAFLTGVLLCLASSPPLRADETTVAVKEETPGLLARAKVTPEVATATAQRKRPKAKLVAAEIEEEDGRLIYSFELKTKRRSGIDEVNVDALSGKVISVTHESPRKEAAERAADARKPREAGR